MNSRDNPRNWLQQVSFRPIIHRSAAVNPRGIQHLECFQHFAAVPAAEDQHEQLRHDLTFVAAPKCLAAAVLRNVNEFGKPRALSTSYRASILRQSRFIFWKYFQQIEV